MKVIGIAPTSFTARDTGEQIYGKTVYLSYPLKREGSIGVGTDKAFLTERRLEGVDLKIGDEIELIRNKEGRVSRILRLSAAR